MKIFKENIISNSLADGHNYILAKHLIYIGHIVQTEKGKHADFVEKTIFDLICKFFLSFSF